MTRSSKNYFAWKYFCIKSHNYFYHKNMFIMHWIHMIKLWLIKVFFRWIKFFLTVGNILFWHICIWIIMGGMIWACMIFQPIIDHAIILIDYASICVKFSTASPKGLHEIPNRAFWRRVLLGVNFWETIFIFSIKLFWHSFKPSLTWSFLIHKERNFFGVAVSGVLPVSW